MRHPSAAEIEEAMQPLREWLSKRKPEASLTNISPSTSGDLYSAIIRSHALHSTTVPQVERLRDALFLPMAKYSADAETAGSCFTAMLALVCDRGVAYSALFSTPEVVGTLFLQTMARVQKSDISANSQDLLSMFKLLDHLTSTADCAVAFRTSAVRDSLFVGCAKYATTSESRLHLLQAICNLADADEGRELFATTAIRDKVIVPSGGIVASPRCCQALCEAIVHISVAHPDCGFELFHNFAIRDKVFMPLAKYVTTDTVARWFFAAIMGVVRHDASTGSVLFGTKAVRDRLFVAPAKHVTSGGTAHYCLEAMFMIVQDSPSLLLDETRRRELFAAKTVRDAIIVPQARLRPSVSLVCRLLVLLTGCNTGVEVYGTTAVRDQLILPMVLDVVTDGDKNNAVAWLATTVGLICQAEDARGKYASPVMRDRLYIPLAVAARCATSTRCVVRAIDRLFTGKDANSNRLVFATPAIRDHFVRFSTFVDDDSAPTFLGAILRLTKVRPTCFATCAVRDMFVRMFHQVSTTQSNATHFFAALRTFPEDLPLQPENEEPGEPPEKNRHPLLATVAGDAPLTFRQEVIILLADQATTATTARRLALGML